MLELKTGDLSPSIRRRILSATNGEPLDLPNADVYFSMLNNDGVRVIDSASGSMEEDDAGNACIPKYQWVAGDTESPGYFRGQFLIVPTSGLSFSVPAGGRWLPILIGTGIVTEP